MTQELNEELLDKLTKVCLCKGISRAVMKKAIRGGAKTVAEVQKLQAPAAALAGVSAVRPRSPAFGGSEGAIK